MEASIAEPARSPRSDRPGLAIAAILAGVAALSLGDQLVRQQGTDFGLWQLFLLRSLPSVPLLIYLARLEGCGITLRPRRPAWTLLRSVILVAMWILYFIALPRTEISVAAAAYYTSPLFIVLLASLFLHERVGARGWLTVALGFAGTLLILRPGGELFNRWSLLPVAAALCYALAMILTRGRCRDERPLILALWLHLGFVVAGALGLAGLALWQPSSETVNANPFLFAPWTPMWLDEWRSMAILAAALLLGSVGAAYAYQRARASTIATFDFGYIALAAIWGWLLFNEVPTPSSAGGILMIVGGGLLAGWRRKRRAAGLPGPPEQS